MNKDLTIGNPATVLWRFCLPLFGSIIFQQLYNIADSLVAGKLIGENALAAVGNSYEITLIFLAFAFGCNIGCSVIVARLFGSKDYSSMKSAVSTSIISTFVLCLLLMFIGKMFSADLLTLIKTPKDIFNDSELYLNIYIWGLPFLFFYNVSTGIFSALGDSKTPFIFLAFSSTANIIADILFVSLGISPFCGKVSGVAWATFICQGVSCLLALAVVFKRLSAIKTNTKAPLFSLNLFLKISAIAVPSILQQSFISVGNIIIQSVINSYGAGVIAGYSAAVKLNNLIVTAFTTLCNGISNYTSQNMGAGRLYRIPQGFKASIKMVWLICIPVVLLYFIFSNTLIGFFMNTPSETALATGRAFLRIISPFYFVISFKLVADGNLRGAGLMRQFMAGTFTDLLLRVILAVVLSVVAGSTGIWCAWPIGWSTALFVSYFFYRQGPWKNAKNNINK